MNIKLLVGLFFLGMIFCCQKEDLETVPAVSELKTENRTTDLSPILDTAYMAIDNSVLSGSENYRNIQFLFNKDSIKLVKLESLSKVEELRILNVSYSSFIVTITFKNPAQQPFIMKVLAAHNPRGSYSFIPGGKNYGSGLETWIQYTRDNQFVSYYDTRFKKWKTKHRYTVTASGVTYRDFIASELPTSNWFLVRTL